MRALRAVQLTLLALTSVLLGVLILLALRPATVLPRPFERFGQPASWPSIAIVVTVLGLLCFVSYWARRNRASATVPVVIVVGLLATGFVLGFASYWSCNGTANPPFFTPLQWAISLVKGGVDERATRAGPCPANPPVALEVARLAILAAFAVSIVGVATAAFRQQSDRMRIGFARRITAVVDVDEDSVSMVSAIAQESSYRGTLALLTSTPDSPLVQECRLKGARVLHVDFNRPETVGTNRLWRRVHRLYLLAPDPSTNLSRLRVVSSRIAEVGTNHRIPLIVRMDDPWLAKAWRAQQFGGSDTRWVADSVGKYEVSARRLLDEILEIGSIERIIICGTNQLTLALCADMARRQIEYDYHAEEGTGALPALSLVDPNADEYREDVGFHEEQRSFGTSSVTIDVVPDVPSAAILKPLIEVAEASTAVVFVDRPWDSTTATRLAARFTRLTIFAWDPQASVTAEAIPIVGRLRNYRLGIDLPDGQAHDNFERAARLIHERYASGTNRDTPALLPWDKLDDFYRESNRRQVRNTLWMVEQLAGHTWNTWGVPRDLLSPEALKALKDDPLAQLHLLGFTDDQIHVMAQAEFEDWSRYYRKAGWTYGPTRDYANRHHEKLVSWEKTTADPNLLNAAVRSLASSVMQLRELGYRSRPMWQPWRRVGSVTAKRRWVPWTWESSSGDTMHARPGDWEVSGDGAGVWSVKDGSFRTSYRREGGNRWAAAGIVLARPARPGEIIDTLEGAERAGEGDWVLQGDAGEQWPVSAEKFAQRYQGPVTFAERFEHWKLLHASG